MRVLTTVAAAAILSASAAQAVVVDLTYTLSTQVSDVRVEGPPPRPEVVGDFLISTFSVRFDTDDGYPIVRDNGFLLQEFIRRFNPLTGAIGYDRGTDLDVVREYHLNVDKTGTYTLSGTNPSNGTIAFYVYEVLRYEVDGLPEIAPVPLPASMPLLAAGIVAGGWAVGKCKKSA